MIIYEKWNEDNTTLLSIIRDPDALKLSKMVGYLLVVEPDPLPDPQTEKKGDYTFPPITWPEERSWEVVAKTHEEINEYQATLAVTEARVANEEIRDLKLNSPYWVDLIGITDVQIDNKVEAATSNVKLQNILKDLSKAIRDRAEADQALKNLGHYGIFG